MKKFDARKEKFNRQRIRPNIILAWHGTPLSNFENITKTNFELSRLGSNTGNKGFYGSGIYFSEFASARVSQGYSGLFIMFLPTEIQLFEYSL